MEIHRIQRAAGIDFTLIGIPQPHDVIKATSRNAIKQLQSVNEGLLNLFESAAEELTALCDGDKHVALLKALAFISGCHKEEMTTRSLLNGQEKFITYQIDMEG